MNIQEGIASREFRVYSDFKSLPASYSSLFSIGAARSFDLSRSWFEHLVTNGMDPATELELCAVEDAQNGSALAFLPLRKTQRGRTLEALATYYSSLFLPLLRQSGDEDTLLRMFSELKNTKEAWPAIKLYPLPHDEDIFESIKRALSGAGWSTFDYFCFGNWYLQVDGRNFSQCWQGLPSQIRNTVERKRKKFERNASGRLEIVKGGDMLEHAIADYQKIYAASWKKPEPFPEFIPGLIRMCAANGELRLGIAYVDEKPVAAQVWIVSHGRASIYKLAYDEQYAELSAGSLLTAHLMRHVIDEDQVHEVDYLTGDDAYKAQWMSHRRERWGLVAYNSATVAGMAGIIRDTGKRWLRPLLSKVK